MTSLINDFETMELFRTGNTDGIINFENKKTKKLLKRIQPNSLMDLCSLYSLTREINAKSLEDFITNKSNPAEITYIHPFLEIYLKETYGVLIFSEQIMAILQGIGKISIKESDLIRKALGKKSTIEIEKYYTVFENGCLNNIQFINHCESINKNPKTCINQIWKLLNEKIIETISFAYVLKYVCESYIQALEISRNQKTAAKS